MPIILSYDDCDWSVLQEQQQRCITDYNYNMKHEG